MKTKASIVAMSGAIMPEPLAMPLMVTRLPSIIGGGGGELGIGVGGHDRFGGGAPAGRAACFGQARQTRVIFSRGSGSPITPVEAMKTSCARQPTMAAADSAIVAHALHARLAGEGIGVAAVDHQRAGVPPLQLLAAPIDRRRRRSWIW